MVMMILMGCEKVNGKEDGWGLKEIKGLNVKGLEKDNIIHRVVMKREDLKIAPKKSILLQEYMNTMKGNLRELECWEVETFDESVCDDGGELPAECCELKCVTGDYDAFTCTSERCFTNGRHCSCGCSTGKKPDDSCCQSDCNLKCEANTTCTIFEEECQCIPIADLNDGVRILSQISIWMISFLSLSIWVFML